MLWGPTPALGRAEPYRPTEPGPAVKEVMYPAGATKLQTKRMACSCRNVTQDFSGQILLS